jgi:HlyD family secretion protein
MPVSRSCVTRRETYHTIDKERWIRGEHAMRDESHKRAEGCHPMGVAAVGLMLLSFLAAAAGCRRGGGAPPGFQGLVEYEQRIIGFEVAGRVRQVPVHRGQAIQAGEVLARLDDVLAVSARDASQAELQAARADLALLQAGARREDIAAARSDLIGATSSEALARRDAERKRALVRAGAMTIAEGDRAESELELASSRRATLESRLALLRRGARPEEIARAQANVESRASALAEVNERLARYVLRAQAPGTVLDVSVKAGEVAAPGTPAVVMADVEHPYADVFVPEAELASIQIGARAEARVDGAPEAFPAAVEYVSPEAEFTPKFLFSDRERPNLVLRARVRIDDRGRRLHAGVPVFVQVAR